MSFYVRIDKLNGLRDHARLGDWLNQSGVIEVEYYNGGWYDTSLYPAPPHLKFENETDAIAYVLAHGGIYTGSVPLLEHIIKGE